ncbi:uncharacterized protein [Pseudorasbora parva]|uniref:uncharacterized protein isoform X1 n=1 Tax=Pseudorasbora parva TaxID=51549 RepID=UPI00351E29FA
MSSVSDYSNQEYVSDTDGSLSDNSCESKELNIWHDEPVKGRAFEFRSTTDTSSSSSYHNSTSVTPMPAKVKRNRYRKKQYCVYCQKPYSKIARHLEFVHRNESEVAKAFSFDKRSKERRVRLRLLKSRGNFAHNVAVSKAGNGEMVACRRPKEVKSAYDFAHCIHCQGLYDRKTLWRHNQTCPQNLQNKNRTIRQKKVQTISNLTLPSPVDVTRSLWTIAGEMVNDEVSNVVRNDRYILLLGQQMYNRLKSYSGRNNYIRQKMREVARLLITARKLTTIRKMEDFIKPGNFPHVIKAVRVVAGFSEETNTYKTPSLALKLGHSLVKIANFVESNARMLGRYGAIESACNFRRLYESKWNEEVSAAALTPPGEAKCSTPQGLDGIMIEPRGSQKARMGRAKSPSMVDLDNAHLQPGTKVSVKRKWSEEEAGAVEKHLMPFIRSRRVPGKTDCASCLMAEPQALKNRDWSAVKFYIYNRITALKRQQRH